MGADAFMLKGNKRYSKELKQQAARNYAIKYEKMDLMHCRIILVNENLKIPLLKLKDFEQN